jgi:ABC-type uncharacterized transport system permease subunit
LSSKEKSFHLIASQPDIPQPLVAHLLQYTPRLRPQMPAFYRLPDLQQTNKRLFCFILVKFHTLPPRLARGFIFADLLADNTDSKSTFI